MKNKVPLVEIENLTWWYPDDPHLIFQNFNFKLYPQEFKIILGKSGVGKTTLTRLLLRQLKPPPKTIFFNKEDLSRFTDKEVQRYRRQIWVIYQDFKLIPWFTVKENIAYPLELFNLPSSEIKKRVEDILRQIDLIEKKDVRPSLLSWWEKQRVAIWRALITKPKFIIADEPTWNLDRQNTTKIADLLIDLNKKWNTILLITHDLQLVDYIKSHLDPSIVTLEKNS